MRIFCIKNSIKQEFKKSKRELKKCDYKISPRPRQRKHTTHWIKIIYHCIINIFAQVHSYRDIGETDVIILLQGVIRDSGDLNMLGSEFKDAYSKRQIDPFDEEAWDQRRQETDQSKLGICDNEILQNELIFRSIIGQLHIVSGSTCMLLGDVNGRTCMVMNYFNGLSICVNNGRQWTKAITFS